MNNRQISIFNYPEGYSVNFATSEKDLLWIESNLEFDEAINLATDWVKYGELPRAFWHSIKDHVEKK